MINKDQPNFKMPSDEQIIQVIKKANSKLGTAIAPYTLSDKYYK